MGNAVRLFPMPGLQHVLVAFFCALALARTRIVHKTPKRYGRNEAHAGGGSTEIPPSRSHSISDYKYNQQERKYCLHEPIVLVQDYRLSAVPVAATVPCLLLTVVMLTGSLQLPQEAALTNPPVHKTSQKFMAVGSLVYLTSVTAVGSVAISHIWAVSNADVQPFLPYISDSGGDPPQSALFGFGVITTAIALMIIFSLRYITVKDVTKGTKDASLIRLFNYLTFVAGLGVFLGLVMVATNATGHLRRDGTWLQPIMLPHLLGASVFFVSGLTYLVGNSVLTWVLVPRFSNVRVAYARIVITLVNLIFCILIVVKFPNDLMSMKPHPYHPRQYPQGTLVSILGEWATVGNFMLYFYTMKSELDMTVIVLGLRRRLNTITGISVVAEGSNPTPQCPKYPQGPLQKDSSSQPRPLDPSQDPCRGR